ncbi:MAG: hypothetical protein KGV44_01600 [Flavobacteriaceae bacterium]|nr:hypothetical protein [Flavobacteriaceae bacterium]
MRKLILSVATFVSCMYAQSQTKDISITASPTIHHTWWDDASGIKDGLLVGGRVGFGFGRNFELRGVYEQSWDIKSTIDEYDGKFKNDIPDFIKNFEEREVEIKRYGAEFKINLINKGVSPYVTIGSGIQELKVNEDEMEQIYATLGMGIKLQLTDRIVLNLEGKNTVFNLDPNTVLPNATHSLETTTMKNWSALAGVQIYLAGRRPEEVSDLDKAYYNKYSGGFSGVSFSAAPMLTYIEFNEDSNFRNSYFLGVSLGVNFNKYITLRGYYLKATQDEKIQLKWDEMAMYGGDVITKLNVARGVVPYLTLGGGYLEQKEDYVGENIFSKADNSSYYAKGGFGLMIPLGRNVEFFGEASLMYSTKKEGAENVSAPDALLKHTVYNAGIRFNIGSSKANTDDALKTLIDKNNQEYENKLAKLQADLEKAYANNDTEKIVEIVKEKKELEQQKDKKQKAIKELSPEKGEQKVRLTPTELEHLIKRAVEEVDAKCSDNSDKKKVKIDSENNANLSDGQYKDLKNEFKTLNRRIDNIERGTLLSRNNMINKGVGKSEKNIEGTVVVDENGGKKKVSSLMYYKGISAYVGTNVGQQTTFNVGVRGHYEFSKSKIQFIPEAYLGLGDPNGFGLNANVIYPFGYKSKFVLDPYVGAGLGFNSIDGNVKFGANIIVGTYVNLWGGKLYVDYTARSFAKNNQVAVGYKFQF